MNRHFKIFRHLIECHDTPSEKHRSGAWTCRGAALLPAAVRVATGAGARGLRHGQPRVRRGARGLHAGRPGGPTELDRARKLAYLMPSLPKWSSRNVLSSSVQIVEEITLGSSGCRAWSCWGTKQGAHLCTATKEDEVDFPNSTS